MGEKMAKLAIKGGNAIRTKPYGPWPICTQKDIERVAEVMRSGNWSYHARKHEMQIEFGEKFARFQDAKYGICTSTGAAALLTSLRAAGAQIGHEVIVPALTFVATASAAFLAGAVPVIVDVDPETYCIDVTKIEEAITDKTKAIVPVHLYSNIADMDRIMEIAKEHNLAVVEDCAHAHGAKWRGKGVGSIGDLGCFSFQQYKVMSSGEGGIITTNDEEFEEKCTAFVDCGRLRRGDKHAQYALGWNYRITEFQAAILLGQLERLSEQIELRERNADYLSDQLRRIDGVSPLKKDERITSRSYYYYVFKYDPAGFDNAPKSRFIRAMYFEGIPCEDIYEPIYRSPLFTIHADRWPLLWDHEKRIDYTSIKCPVAEKASSEEAVAISLIALHGEKSDVDDVTNAIQKIKENAQELHGNESTALKAIRATRQLLTRKFTKQEE
jgi:L-glutamine:2-deoxy-scyllo-inosose/3-amino-2,3-dideoxy-scyllo-inosose aminotransferase